MEAKDYKFKFYNGEEECPDGVWPVGWEVERRFSENPKSVEYYFKLYEGMTVGQLPEEIRNASVDDAERASAYALAGAADGPVDLAVKYYLDPSSIPLQPKS